MILFKLICDYLSFNYIIYFFLVSLVILLFFSIISVIFFGEEVLNYWIKVCYGYFFFNYILY